MDRTPTGRFAVLVQGPEATLQQHLDEATLLIAAHANLGLDVDHYRRRLDAIAARCAEPVLAEVSHQLFGVEGLRGNDEDYYDPRNSYLDEVLDRRLGIPITLSVAFLEVGRRLGLPLAGVSMPGHFLVRLLGEPAVLVDPFVGGGLLSEAECEARFRELQGPTVPWDRAYLEPVATIDIVARMLNNLRSVHLQRQDSASLDWVLQLRCLLPGASLDDRSERAGVLAAQARFGEAADLLERLADEAPDAKAASYSSKAKRLRARLN
ncbi:MAG TPA: transglutaminase-like domain-containing protein [Acidimicrobiales bacterium]|nr:transglutaminase-like domain-containing protein [Acidimicrobiales bacterium]